MLPSEDTSDDRFLIEIDTVVGKWKVLKRGAFFGPNASGKTSFIDSLSLVLLLKKK
jgi:AAA15 family ATPase/GTPase